MKKVVLSSVLAALFMFTGCSDKEVVVEDPSAVKSEVKEVSSIETEVVSAQDSVVNSSSLNTNINDVQEKIKSVYFAFDKFNVTDSSRDDITNAASIVQDSGSEFNIKLEGNCDEWGSDEYNIALGLKRASSVKKALVAEGVDAERISMVSFGESNPTCSDKTQECWSKNRRVDFKLLP
jgi:peptidoglycan-associated lipoprotein